ncbi:Pentatricopeptide repeat-containing protein [Thalictrum thalictroides]|uniref:Pentatricopeptide repeat-containing protein n=1 Tax=Thalictrum thalictroides TaxID=46969 RepID=A0A7J6XEW4_THATH|nr:Pentatricopeptide repeat-containing protein [Thalictrum thalictroides]
MPQRDVVSFNTFITAYTRSDCNEALLLSVRMQEEGVKPNHITFSTLIGAKGMVMSHSMEVLHAQAIQYGLSSNEFVGSSLVDGYAKRMRLEDSIRAFDEIAELDLVSWNIMIDVCVRNGRDQCALRVFSSLRLEGVHFDGFTLSSIIKTCSEPRELEQGMQLHGCAIKAGLASEIPISNAFITMYSKCEKGMLSSIKVFEGILAPNIISWTAMVAGFMQNGLNEDAVSLYRKMLRYGVRENEFSFASILPAYSGLARLEQGMQVHARIVKSSFSLDVSVRNALIDMYFKCGSLTDAKLAFKTMERRDVVSWTVMVTGLGQHGEGKEAVNILKAMISEGMRPDAVTFLGSLSACSHGGLVEEGLQVFRSMINVHNVKPRREHYACVVDMLGRAGRLEEAENFIVDMGFESDVVVWETLLSACRTHGEKELGERSAQKIMELDPKHDGPYVLLANIYADKGLWEDKGRTQAHSICSKSATVVMSDISAGSNQSDSTALMSSETVEEALLQEGDGYFHNHEYKKEHDCYESVVKNYHNMYGNEPESSKLKQFIKPIIRQGISILCHKFLPAHHGFLLKELRTFGVDYDFGLDENKENKFRQGTELMRKAYGYACKAENVSRTERFEIHVHLLYCDAVLGTREPVESINNLIDSISPMTDFETGMIIMNLQLLIYMTHSLNRYEGEVRMACLTAGIVAVACNKQYGTEDDTNKIAAISHEIKTCLVKLGLL